MSDTNNVFGDDPFQGESFPKKYPEPESTPLVFMTTTSSVEGKSISDYHGLVFGEAAFGIGLGTDVFQSLQSFFGVRGGSSEHRMEEVRRQAMYNASEHAKALGANAIVGIRVDYEFTKGMMFVSISGTAVSVDL